MGDSGEGLVDNESRIQERIEELRANRADSRKRQIENPEETRRIESLMLARTQMTRQLNAVSTEIRRVQIQKAIADLDLRIGEIRATTTT